MIYVVVIVGISPNLSLASPNGTSLTSNLSLVQTLGLFGGSEAVLLTISQFIAHACAVIVNVFASGAHT